MTHASSLSRRVGSVRIEVLSLRYPRIRLCALLVGTLQMINPCPYLILFRLLFYFPELLCLQRIISHAGSNTTEKEPMIPYILLSPSIDTVWNRSSPNEALYSWGAS